MAATTIEDIIPRDLLEDYVVDSLASKSTLMAAGLVTVDTSPIFQAGGQTFAVPRIKPLSAKGQDQQIEADTDLDVKSLDTYKETGVIVRFGDAIGISDSARLAAGADLFGQISPQIAEVHAWDVEEKLIKATLGAFGIAGMSSHIQDESTALFNLVGVTKAKGKLGRGRRKLRALIVHSAVGTYMEEMGLTKYVDVGTFGQDILLTGQWQVAAGLLVIENDELCAPSAGVYPSYLAGQGAWYLGYQRGLAIEYDRQILKEGGTDIIKWDSHYVPHVRGISWAGSLASLPFGPALSDLADQSNWSKVAPKAEDILLVQYKSRIALA